MAAAPVGVLLAAGDVWLGVVEVGLLDVAGEVAGEFDGEVGLGLGAPVPAELPVASVAVPGGEAAMEKDPEVASTLEMFPICTASSVYPDATGTDGRSIIVLPSDALTESATAKGPLI